MLRIYYLHEMYVLIKYILIISLLLFKLLTYIKLFFTILYMQSPPLRILKPTPQLKIIQIVSNTWNMIMLQVRISEYQQCTIYAQQQVIVFTLLKIFSVYHYLETLPSMEKLNIPTHPEIPDSWQVFTRQCK